MTRRYASVAAIIIVTVILIDQIVKIWIKTSFYLGEDYQILPWFHLLFVENNGMAFGMTIGSKLALTMFRIVVVSFLGVYLYRVARIPHMSLGYVVCLSLIIAGAAGNIFDCVFYGVIFNDPWPPEVASFLPAGGGYAPLFMGRVVDMLYFPLFSFTWPEWMPMVGGEEFLFFHPVFNVADAAISCGIVALIIFYHRFILGPKALDRMINPTETNE
ncbi:MAG: lipoprotein signal peptidase [Muribaculaceae bacterium]|nr:lipoprotein signal peptidase [Muribaculaceae bacterium]